MILRRALSSSGVQAENAYVGIGAKESQEGVFAVVVFAFGRAELGVGDLEDRLGG